MLLFTAVNFVDSAVYALDKIGIYLEPTHETKLEGESVNFIHGGDSSYNQTLSYAESHTPVAQPRRIFNSIHYIHSLGLGLHLDMSPISKSCHLLLCCTTHDATYISSLL